MNRETVATITQDLRARAARIRETNSSKAEDVAAVMEALVAFTGEDADRDEDEREPASVDPAPPAPPAPADPTAPSASAVAPATSASDASLLDRLKDTIGL